jgi:hypothetical protein
MSTSVETISGFEAFLSEAGLKCVRREAPANAMGYKLIEFAGSNIRVRLTWEKGFWDLRVADTTIATDVWYDVRLFTYWLGGPAQSEMPFERQLEYVKNHWPEIVSAFSPNRQVQTHVRLDAAKKERARKIFAVWPTAVLDLESFLKQAGFVCTYRKEPRFAFDWMAMRYADSRIAVQMDSEQGWRVKFADVNHNPDRWYSFSSIRKFIQWPEDRKLTYAESFEFIKANWSKIVSMFAPETSKETHERLDKIEHATAMPLGKGTD